MSRVMRPYQGVGYTDIFEGWKTDDILMFILATGGGKTFTFTEVIRTVLSRGSRAMLIAHREELIQQSWQTLYDAGVYAGIIMAQHPKNYSLPCQVCSIQTIVNRKHLPDVDYIIIDESHHVQKGNSYGKILQRYPNAKVLMVTATPYRLSGDGFLEVLAGKITKLIINRTLAELIEEAWLVPLEYHIGSIPDLSGVKISKGEYDEEGVKEVMERAPLVDSYLEHCPGKQGLVFAVDIADSKRICENYNRAGISAVHIDANTPSDQRKSMLEDYRAGRIMVVCNVGIFTEGTDFPGCQFVQLAAPSKSLSKIFQEIGRVTRAACKVDDYHTPEERRAAIAASKKPVGIVLDNAGTWLEHGFADEPVDWPKYFVGWKKEKKVAKEVTEMIEIPIFEIEDPITGSRRTTEKIKEVEGMRLIKVTKEERVNLKAIKYLQVFDDILDRARCNPKINKPGFFSYYRFREHCDTAGITIIDEAWKYIKQRLVTEVDDELLEYRNKQAAAGRLHVPAVSAAEDVIRRKGVFYDYLKREWQQYKAGLRKYIVTKENTQTIHLQNDMSNESINS